MYVCMYVCMYVYMYVCMYAHSHVHRPVLHVLQLLVPAVRVTHSASNDSCGRGLVSAQHPRFWKQGLWRIGCHRCTVVCTHAVSTHWQDKLNIYNQMLANEH